MAVGKKKKKPKVPLSNEQLRKREEKKEKAALHRMVVSAFGRAGFTHHKSEGVTIKVVSRSGEFDNLFVFENVVLSVEETVLKTSKDHMRGKAEFAQHLMSHPAQLYAELRRAFPEIARSFDKNGVTHDNLKFACVYCPRYDVTQEYRERYADSLVNIDHAQLKYFAHLAKTIQLSARFEIFKLLKLSVSDIGNPEAGNRDKNVHALLIKEEKSGLLPGYRCVSFLIDPESLIRLSYVLRSDGWVDSQCVYQRLLVPKKIRDMRAYLATEGRVFVNNIVATLPASARVVEDRGTAIVTIPDEFNTIGLIDGQHRVLCYHEADEKEPYEKKIRWMRKKQTLLVTAIVCDATVKKPERERFEAKLFLEINDKQKKVRGDLKHSIEVIINPNSRIAIAKSVLVKLAANGPLHGLLQTHFFDTGKIKTTSIVSYGLNYLVDIGVSNRSLLSRWADGNKVEIEKDEAVRDEYIAFCASNIGMMFGGFRDGLPRELWTPDKSVSRALTPTVINSVLHCMMRLIENGKPLQDHLGYRRAFSRLKMNFEASAKWPRGSSHWSKIGEEMYRQCFASS